MATQPINFNSEEICNSQEILQISWLVYVTASNHTKLCNKYYTYPISANMFDEYLHLNKAT